MRLGLLAGAVIAWCAAAAVGAENNSQTPKKRRFARPWNLMLLPSIRETPKNWRPCGQTQQWLMVRLEEPATQP